MTGKLFANLLSILIFINAVAAQAAVTLTDLSASYPGLAKYAAISLAIAAFLTPFLPRIQKIGQTINEAQRNN